MYQVIISRVAEKQLEHIPKQFANAITLNIELLKFAPRPKDAKSFMVTIMHIG